MERLAMDVLEQRQAVSAHLEPVVDVGGVRHQPWKREADRLKRDPLTVKHILPYSPSSHSTSWASPPGR
eukprot:3826540-Heterocapsa_arctica.AAC.1